VGMTAAAYWWNLALYDLGCNTLRLGGLNTEQRLHYLRSYGAEQMLIDSHYLRRMTYIARNLGYKLRRDMARMAAIFVGGGGWSDEEAKEWAEEWGAVLYEQYGSSQRCIAWTCEKGIFGSPGRGVVHTLPHQYLLEVVDPVTGEHVGEGDEGEIVITLFGYQAMPLVRYGSRDRGRWRTGASCGCGRPFDGLEAGSVGRLDDMLRVRGRNLWPDQVDKTVFASESVADYRAEVWQDEAAGERLSLRAFLVPGAVSRGGPLAEELTSRLRQATGLRFDVSTYVLGDQEMEVTALAGAKPRRWADRRGMQASGPSWQETI
jgi:phenylacetate-CoA ligase